MTRLLQSIRVGFRGLRHTPGFALTAIATLALGIGLTTAVFTVAQALLLRRLPVHDQDRLVVLSGVTRDKAFDNYPLGIAEAAEFVRRSGSLQRAAWFAYEGASPKPIREGDQVSHLRRALVSGDFFEVLGVQPVLGRALRSEDDVRGAAPVLVLSHRAWQRRFAGDPGVLGRRVLMYEDGVAYTIVGVMPQGLEYPAGTDAWAPLIPSTEPDKMSFVAAYVIGRLSPTATPADAGNDLSSFYRRSEASPWERDFSGIVHTLPRLILGETRAALLVFAGAAALLLLITCVNVANLLFVRGLARVREFAVRSALGAGRRQIIGQLLAENALLAVAGGVAGLAVAAATVLGFVAFAPVGLPRLDEIRLNPTVLAGAVGITGVAMLLFGLAPAVMASRVDLRQVLRSGVRQSPSRRFRAATEALVVGQIAIALIVLAAAGLIARSLVRLERAELSFEPSGLLLGELALSRDQYSDAKQQLALLDRLLPRVLAIPGVRAASPVVAVPFSGTGGWDGRLAAEGQSPEEATTSNPMLNMEVVTPGYFAALGVPLLHGRGFTDADREGAPAVVIVSQSVARHFWPDRDPLGGRLRMGPESERALTVIGVVPDTRYRDLRDARPSIYFPMHQSVFPFAPMALAIRTSGSPVDLAATIRRVIGEAEPGVMLTNTAPFEAFLERPLAQPRLNALLLAVFAGAAAVLAGVGLFSIIATMVRQRTHELGVRMALGATGENLRWMVLRRGVALALAGIVGGLLAALATNRLLVSLLYEVSPMDGLTLLLVAGFLLAITIVASGIPAQSSTRVDPVSALRADG